MGEASSSTPPMFIQSYAVFGIAGKEQRLGAVHLACLEVVSLDSGSAHRSHSIPNLANSGLVMQL